MSADTWAVVVNWNGGDANLECLASLAAEGLAEDRIAFVDNASSDGSTERVLAAHPALVVLRNDRNLGFGHGANRGIEHALARGAGHVLLLNNDAVLGEGALAALEAALENPEVGIVGPRVLYKGRSDRIWSCGGTLTFRQNLTTMIGHGRPDGPEYRRSFDVDYVTGCAMLVRREVFEQAGLFEGDYFAYHEDVELCVAAREHGFRSRTVGEVAAYHDAHGATGGGYNARRKYMMGVNTVWFLRRHGTPLRWLSFFAFDVLSLPLVWAWRAYRGEGDAVLAKARGTLDGLRGRRVTAEVLGTAAAARHERAA